MQRLATRTFGLASNSLLSSNSLARSNLLHGTEVAAGVTVMCEARRGIKKIHLPRRRAKARQDKKRGGLPRDSSGKVIQRKKEKLAPLFTPLNADQLRDPIFEPQDRLSLKFPRFAPKTVTRTNIGQAMEFATSQTNPSQHFGLPKKLWKEFRLLSKPCSVVRDVTVDVVETLDAAKTKPSAETRLTLSGRAGCGKSILLLQAVEHCVNNDWVVLYIPRAVNLVNSTTPYAYDLRTQTFLQSEASYQILQRARAANANTFKALRLQNPLVAHGVEGEKREISSGTSLYELLDIPREQVTSAPIILETLVNELQAQTAYPVLVAVDDFQALFCRTAYRDPHFKPIASYHLQVPRLLLEIASGRKSFAKGAFVGALTNSDPFYSPTLELCEALDLPTSNPVVPFPLIKRSRFLYQYAQGLKKIEVPEKLSVDEAAGIFEIWMKHKVLSSKAHDELFMSKYVESSGNAGDFVWKGLLATLES